MADGAAPTSTRSMIWSVLGSIMATVVPSRSVTRTTPSPCPCLLHTSTTRITLRKLNSRSRMHPLSNKPFGIAASGVASLSYPAEQRDTRTNHLSCRLYAKLAFRHADRMSTSRSSAPVRAAMHPGIVIRQVRGASHSASDRPGQ